MAAMAAFKNRDVKVLQLFADDGIIFPVFDRIQVDIVLEITESEQLPAPTIADKGVSVNEISR